MSYDPNSSDSMFARIDQRLTTQDGVLADILAEVRKTNGRVTKLETAAEVGRARIAIIATVVSGTVGVIGWAANTLLSK